MEYSRCALVSHHKEITPRRFGKHAKIAADGKNSLQKKLPFLAKEMYNIVR